MWYLDLKIIRDHLMSVNWGSADDGDADMRTEIHDRSPL